MDRRLTVFALVAAVSVPVMLAAADEPAARVAAPDAAELARRAKVYARVGERSITVGDIEDAIAAETTFRPERFADPARLAAFAESLVDRAVLARAAERSGLDAKPAVRRALDRSLVQHFIRGEFDEPWLTATIPAEDVAAYYKAHEAEFNTPALARASHILLDDEDEAKALIASLRDKGHRDFQAAVRNKSLDEETKLSGGDLRLFTPAGLPPDGTGAPVHPALVAAAFTLDERGELYPRPIPIGERFSVLMLTQTRPAASQSLEQATPAIERALRQERRQAALTSLLEALTAQAKPVVHPETLLPITIAPPDEPLGLPPHPHPHAGDETHSH